MYVIFFGEKYCIFCASCITIVMKVGLGVLEG